MSLSQNSHWDSPWAICLSHPLSLCSVWYDAHSAVTEYLTRSHLREGGRIWFGSEFEVVVHHGRSCLSTGGHHSCGDKLVSLLAHMWMHQEAESRGLWYLSPFFPLPFFSSVLDSSLWDSATLILGGGSVSWFKPLWKCPHRYTQSVPH